MSTATNRIDRAFADLAARQRKGLLPFLAAGFPDLDTTEALLAAMAELGVTAVELGFPYSDPLADGPVIQTAFSRALDQGLHVGDIFAMISRFRQRYELPLIGMLSYTIVHRYGLDRFLADAAKAGLDGLILPDLSLEEAPEVAAKVHAAGLRLPMLLSPTSPPDRQQKIGQMSSGFVYYMSVTGVTGERDQLPTDLVDNVRRLRENLGKPIVVGFGISKAEHVRNVCSVADGAIIGSALVRRIIDAHDAGQDSKQVIATASEAVREWLTGLD